MANLTETDVLELINTALDLKKQKITLDSSMDNVAEWDSLAHLSIIVTLDKAFGKKVGKITEMATANSVKKILQLLKENSLI